MSETTHAIITPIANLFRGVPRPEGPPKPTAFYEPGRFPAVQPLDLVPVLKGNPALQEALDAVTKAVRLREDATVAVAARQSKADALNHLASAPLDADPEAILTANDELVQINRQLRVDRARLERATRLEATATRDFHARATEALGAAWQKRRERINGLLEQARLAMAEWRDHELSFAEAVNAASAPGIRFAFESRAWSALCDDLPFAQSLLSAWRQRQGLE